MAQALGESRVGQWATAGAGELAAAARRLRVRLTGVPQGLSRAQLEASAAKIRARAVELGYGDDVFVQGSRVSGRAKPTSDIDFGVRVSDDDFASAISRRFKTPSPGSDKEETMLHAVATGKIQSGEAGFRAVRKELERDLGMKVDLSVIRRGGPFDRGPILSPRVR